MNNKILKVENLLMIAILIIAFVIRIVNVRYGYPLQTHPDEPVLVDAALNMIKTGDLNPHNFQYPSLNIYLQALLFFIVQLPATIFGVQLFPTQLIDFHVYGRILNVIFSILTIYIVYEIGRRLFNAWTGLAAMCFITASSLHVEHSFYATVDTTTAFWPSVACLMAVMIYQGSGHKKWYYIFGGICVGLAIGSKYTAFLAFLPILITHIYHARENNKWIDKNIVSSLLAVLVGFLITTPYALLDYKTFFNGLLFQSMAYISHPGYESQTTTSFHVYFNDLFTEGYGEIPTILAFIGFIALSINKRWEASLLISFPFAIFLFLGFHKVYFSRNILPVIPFMALLSGYSINVGVELFEKFRQHSSLNTRGYSYAALGLGVMLVLFSIKNQISTDIRMIRDNILPDTRWVSLKWIQQNIPPNIKIGREHYTPPIEMYSDKYDVTYYGLSGVAIYQKKIESMNVMIVSSSDYSRFVDHPDQYPMQAMIYNNFFTCNDLIKEFVEDGKTMSGPTIGIYTIKYGVGTRACITPYKQDKP